MAARWADSACSRAASHCESSPSARSWASRALNLRLGRVLGLAQELLTAVALGEHLLVARAGACRSSPACADHARPALGDGDPGEATGQLLEALHDPGIRDESPDDRGASPSPRTRSASGRAPGRWRGSRGPSRAARRRRRARGHPGRPRSSRAAARRTDGLAPGPRADGRRAPPRARARSRHRRRPRLRASARRPRRPRGLAAGG